MIDNLRWLNPKNPDVRSELISFRSRHNIPQWDKLTEDQRTAFELDFMKRYILSEYQRTYDYPFFMSISLPEVATAAQKYEQRHQIPHGCPWPDAVRNDFEQELAAQVTTIITGIKTKKRDNTMLPPDWTWEARQQAIVDKLQNKGEANEA